MPKDVNYFKWFTKFRQEVKDGQLLTVSGSKFKYIKYHLLHLSIYSHRSPSGAEYKSTSSDNIYEEGRVKFVDTVREAFKKKTTKHMENSIS